MTHDDLPRNSDIQSTMINFDLESLSNSSGVVWFLVNEIAGIGKYPKSWVEV